MGSSSGRNCCPRVVFFRELLFAPPKSGRIAVSPCDRIARVLKSIRHARVTDPRLLASKHTWESAG